MGETVYRTGQGRVVRADGEYEYDLAESYSMLVCVCSEKALGLGPT